MPELPEVETIRRDLQNLVVGRVIEGAKVFYAKLLRGYPAAKFTRRVTGQKITGVGRRAKILIIDLDSGDRLLVHLKMSGRFTYEQNEAEAAKHTHLIFSLDNGYELRFVDTRKFGYFRLIEGGILADTPELKHLGPEPLASDFTPADLKRLIKTKSDSKRPIKAFLIDQTFLAGVGNLYADEILHAAKIKPSRRLVSLSESEIDRLYNSLRAILTTAIQHRGTSFDLYVDAHGQRGAYVEQLDVYGREGQPCPRCGAGIEKIRIAGRGTHFCATCQS